MNVPLKTVIHVVGGASFDPEQFANFDQATQAVAAMAATKSVDNALPVADQENAILADLPNIANATPQNDAYQLDSESGEKSKLVGYDEEENPIWAYDTGDVSGAIIDGETKAIVGWVTFSASE